MEKHIDIHVCRVWESDGWYGGRWKNVILELDSQKAKDWMNKDIKNRDYDTLALEYGGRLLVRLEEVLE